MITMPTARTPDAFRALPMLLSYQELLHWGIPERQVGKLVASGALTFVVLHKGGRRKYHKTSVARVLGIPL